MKENIHNLEWVQFRMGTWLPFWRYENLVVCGAHRDCTDTMNQKRKEENDETVD